LYTTHNTLCSYRKKYNVVITLLEELNDEKEIQDFSSQTDSFAFWKVKEEDLYQDYLKKNENR